MIVYNKLVRYNIPEIIAKDGRIANIRVLSDEEYKNALDEKSMEEVKEYEESKETMKLVDIEEIILAILKSRGISTDEFEKMRLEKKKNGDF